jgi:peptidoglycan pentaglycine glycine transferase (the first glycine)
MAELSTSDWETFLRDHPNAHLLQTAAWGELKGAFGWTPLRITAGDSGAQLLMRSLLLGFSIAYIPRGPVGTGWQALLPEIHRACRRRRVVFLKIEPDIWELAPTDLLQGALSGFVPSPQTVQPPRTVVVNLEGSEEDLLGRMKPKTRYNIRLAQKKEVIVRPSSDINAFYRMMTVTGARDGFGIHSLAYYQKAYQLFHPGGGCELLQAEYAGQPLAALMVFAQGRRAWYFYGASTDQERNRMPTYLLQWEAMRWARARGCHEYDLWGIPDIEETELEAEFAERSGGLWGVYRFKRGFGGQVRRTIAAWDHVYQPILYQVYRAWVSRRKAAGDGKL